MRLTWDCIDFQNKTVRIPISKTRQENVAPLLPEIAKLFPVVPINRQGKVFGALSYSALKDRLHKACVTAGVKVVGLHEFAVHSFVARRVAAGHSLP